MKKTVVLSVVGATLLMAITLSLFPLAGCRSAPMTGRKQLLLVPESQEISMGLTAYEDVLSKEQPSDNVRAVQMVNRVGERIAAVSGRPEYKWEFRVVQSAEQNAFCLPGGKVAVYEGILPVCQNEAGLAVVMSHEIAHALARHGGERMSHEYMVNGAGKAVSIVLQNQEAQRRESMMKAFGLASQYGFVLPYSRKHETEADQMGIMLMAQAGYDPAEAPRFWERFGEVQKASGGGKQPEWLSTHPADARRAQDLAALVPEATVIYHSAPQHYGQGDTIVASTGVHPTHTVAKIVR